jgi:hypothetical protein
MTMKRARLFPVLTLLIAACSLAWAAQDQKPQGKYAPYCGEYQFDLTAYGAGIITAKVYVENDLLYIWADKSEPPDVMTPVENVPTKFYLDDPDEGHWDIEFLKDDQGKYTKCRLVNAGLGIEVVGDRIGD